MKYPIDDRYKEKKKEYGVIPKKEYKDLKDNSESLEKLLIQRRLFE